SVDVWIEGIANAKIKHDSKVILFVGTKQIETKILLYESEESIEKGYAKLLFNQKMFLVHNEPFIICVSGRTIGGGRVLNPVQDPIKKKVKMQLLQALNVQDFKTAFEILVNIHRRGFGLISSNQRFGLNHDEAICIAKEIDNIFVDEKNLVLYPMDIKDELAKVVYNIYNKNQYALLSANSLVLKIKWASQALLEEVLEEICKSGKLTFENGIYKNAHIDIDNIETLVEEKIYEILKTENFTPTAPYNIYEDLDIDRKMGDDALKRLTRARKVVRLAHNLFVTTDTLTTVMSRLRELIRTQGYVDINMFREHYDFSRKYLIAYLDYLDLYDDIKKDGDKRILNS
ncbi:MAG TPA: selenocysteine-specific translation elongation factor, partial [Sulfurospirillum sp. UBA11407]